MRALPVVATIILLLTILHVYITLGRLPLAPAHILEEHAAISQSPATQPGPLSLRLLPPPPPPPPPPPLAMSEAAVRPPPLAMSEAAVRQPDSEPTASRVHAPSAACSSKRLRDLLSPTCGADAFAESATEEADSKRLQAALRAQQNPEDCTRRRIVRFKDWRNGLGAQLSSLIGAWSSQLDKTPSLLAPGSTLDADATTEPLPVLLVPAGGLRYANKALCPQRDLTCYFEPLSSCAAPEGAKSVRPAKMSPALADRMSEALSLRHRRDKWWVRKEMMRYVFRPNAATHKMLSRVRREMKLRAPRRAAGQGDGGDDDGGGDGDPSSWPRIDDLVAIHVRRGDKKDLGAKERGEPFTDAMYVRAAVALADELGASGFLLASSEPGTLKRLPALLSPRPTYQMPAHYFVDVPEGLTPHQVVERTAQEGGSNDEGLSQIVQLLLLSESRAFLGTVTSNFGLLVTKLMAFVQPTPVALDLSCAGLTSMRADPDDGRVWAVWERSDAGATALAPSCRGRTGASGKAKLKVPPKKKAKRSSAEIALAWEARLERAP